MAETEVPEVEWRAFSRGELGGVMVQLLNNQLMAPDWNLRSSAQAETLITVGFKGSCQTGYVMSNDIRNFREV